MDLDGTLAEYTGWVNEETIGKPIGPMVARVRAWLSRGLEVRIFTARATDITSKPNVKRVIQQWCAQHVGQVLPITNVKDYDMQLLWDDRAIQVVQNTGLSLGEHMAIQEGKGSRYQ